MEIVWPATTRVPARTLEVGFAVTWNDTEPMPVWLSPFVIVIHGTVLVAVQEHCVPVTTLVDWTFAVDTVENVVWVTEYEHCAEASDVASIQISTTNAKQRRIVMVVSR